jgi:MFS family permease
MGILSAMIPAPIYSLPPEILNPENVGLGFGVISTCSSIGLFVAPYLVGKVKDFTGSDSWSFILISIFFFLVMIFIFLTYRSRKKFFNPSLTLS